MRGEVTILIISYVLHTNTKHFNITGLSSLAEIGLHHYVLCLTHPPLQTAKF